MRSFRPIKSYARQVWYLREFTAMCLYSVHASNGGIGLISHTLVATRSIVSMTVISTVFFFMLIILLTWRNGRQVE